MILDQENTAILIIDIQDRLINAVFNKDLLYKKAESIVKAAEILNIPIFITEQYPQGLGETVGNLKRKAKVYVKTTFNALEDESLLKEIKTSNKKQIIVCGIETHICVHQTVAALLKEDFDVTVISDACGSRSEAEYTNGLNNIKENGAKIKTTEMILFELIKSAKHPYFKEIQALIK